MRMMFPRRASHTVLAIALLGGIFAVTARAQEVREPAGTPLPAYAKVYPQTGFADPLQRFVLPDDGLPVIMLTGYWPPTNEMLRQFSPNAQQNPGIWAGDNWEGRGYDVYAFFPEFPTGLGKGEGDFEVDYQDTSGDFWALVAQLQPIAIIAYGRAGSDSDWELEGANRRYTTTLYSADYLAPTRPTAELPFYNEPVNTQYPSTLPIQAVISAIQAEPGLTLNPFGTVYDESRFLCSFMGYHVNWYHNLHSAPGDPARCLAAGFIHLGSAMSVETAVIGSEITLREVIKRVNRERFPGDLDGDGVADATDGLLLLAALAGPGAGNPGVPYEHYLFSDRDGDTDVDLADFGAFQPLLVAAGGPGAGL